MQVPERALSRAGDSLAHLLGADHEYVAQNAKASRDPVNLPTEVEADS